MYWCQPRSAVVYFLTVHQYITIVRKRQGSYFLKLTSSEYWLLGFVSLQSVPSPQERSIFCCFTLQSHTIITVIASPQAKMTNASTVTPWWVGPWSSSPTPQCFQGLSSCSGGCCRNVTGMGKLLLGNGQGSASASTSGAQQHTYRLPRVFYPQQIRFNPKQSR